MKTNISILLYLVLFQLQFMSANEKFKQLTIENGLAHTDASCIVQDSTGLIWIGTYAGLQSFDGYTLQNFDYYPSGHKIYQSHNRIESMACSKNKLWIGTESGLTCFDLNTHRYVPYYTKEDIYNKSPFNISITKVFTDPTGKYLWIKSEQGLSAMKIYDGSLQILRWESEAERIFCKSINELLFQGETIWASNNKHIIQLCIQNEKINIQNTYLASELLQTNEKVHNIYYSNNHLYIRTSNGCYKISTAGNKLNKTISAYINFHQANPKIPSFTIGKFIVTREETLWCAYDEGIFEVEQPFSATPVIYEYLKNNKNSNLSAIKIKNILIDKYENLWVTTNSWGVFYRNLSQSFFKNFSKQDFQEMGFLQNEIVSVTGQKNGTLWMIVEYASLLRYDPKTELFSLISLPKNSNRPTYYQTIQISRDQKHLYIGTSHNVLIYNIQTQKLSQLIPNNNPNSQKINTSISDLAEDESGRLWICTWGNGLSCIKDPLNAPSIEMELDTQTDPALLSKKITQLFIRGKYIFLCTTNGLNRIELTHDGKIKTIAAYQAEKGLLTSMSSNYLASIDCLNDSVCWVGTIGGGLNKIVLHSANTNDYTATCYTTINGLPNNDCEIVLIDESEDIWVGSNGIVQLETKNDKINTYGFANGLQNNAFKVNVSYKDDNGMLYMGGLYGLSYFNPKELIHKTKYNKLIFKDLSINNLKITPQNTYNGEVILEQILDNTSKLTLNYQQNNFSISFAALGYDLSGQIMYRYRLKGFQKDWQTLQYTNNEIYFSNLPYRSYQLEVQLSTDKGYTWHEPGKKLDIDILPPWWLSGWAKITYIILIIGGAMSAFRQYSKEQNLKRENEIQKILIAQDEEKYQAKMQFFMNASHELKTPLTLILLAAEKLVGKTQLQKEHDTILHNARKILTLITELVDIRKQDIGIASLNLEHLDFSQITRQLFNETRLWAENKHIGISYSADEVNIKMDADKNKIGKMIINIFSNAIKYTDERGKIDITLRRGSLNDIKPCYDTMHVEGKVSAGPLCILTVKDTGIGISSESIRLIYERFFQVRGKTQEHLGSGIGLAIVKSIVLQHQGMIIVSSERMIGSEFIIALPIHNDLPEQPNTNDQDFDVKGFINSQYDEFQLNRSIEGTEENIPSNPELPTLLIVEDNKELQAALKEHLSTSYNIHIADNGRIGLELCRSIFPDIIISDVMMPEMDGIEMCRCIKNNLSIAYIPLIMLTAKDNIESQIEGYESGADLYIPKPFSMKLLEVNLHRLLTQREKWFRNKNNLSTSPILEIKLEEKTENGETKRQKTFQEKEVQKSMLSSEELKEITEKLKKVIAENIYDPNLSPDQLASALGMSRTKFYRDIKGIDGQSLSDYVRNTRLEKAAHLLCSSHMNIQEIMNEVGFINSSHFTKIFKLKFEMTPTEYKKKH